MLDLILYLGSQSFIMSFQRFADRRGFLSYVTESSNFIASETQEVVNS